MLRATLFGLLLAVSIAGTTQAQSPTVAGARQPLRIPAGPYFPFFRSASNAGPMHVREFWLDPEPATRGEYLEFVRLHPEWRKSRVKPLVAENNYLADWHDDLDPGAVPLDRPVTFVSWFAARAYCSAKGKRLATVAEWERVAGARPPNVPERPSSNAAGSQPFKFAMGRPALDLRGQALAVGKVWEWNGDFNSSPFGVRADGASNTKSSLFCGDGYRSTNALDYAAFLRYSLRSSLRGNHALKNLGFRCARDAR